MARSRRGGSAVPDESLDPPAGEPEATELIDPLQVASEGLEEIDEESADRPEEAGEGAPRIQDPLAVLSLAIDEEEAQAASGQTDEAPRRGLFGRRGRARTSNPSALEPREDDNTGPAAQAEPHAAAEVTGTPSTPSHTDPVDAEEAPRVTTWAQDFEEFQTTGSMPAIKVDTPGSVVEATDSDAQRDDDPGPQDVPTQGGARRASRRLRRRRKQAEQQPDQAVEAPDETPTTAAAEPEGPEATAAAAEEPKEFLGEYLDVEVGAEDPDLGHAPPVEHVVDERWDVDVDGGEPGDRHSKCQGMGRKQCPSFRE